MNFLVGSWSVCVKHTFRLKFLRRGVNLIRSFRILAPNAGSEDSVLEGDSACAFRARGFHDSGVLLHVFVSVAVFMAVVSGR